MTITPLNLLIITVLVIIVLVISAKYNIFNILNIFNVPHKPITGKIKYYIHDSNIDPNFKNITSAFLKNSIWNNHYNLEEVYINDKSNSLKNRNDIDIYVQLMNDADLEKYHEPKQYYPDGTQIRWSITTQDIDKKPNVYINAKSWINGVKESGLTLNEYREYVINHEFGHALGYEHISCNNNTMRDNKCPVMYQSTRGCPENIKCGYRPSDVDVIGNKMPNNYLRNN